VGPYICVLKTHVDIFDQWDEAIVQQLQQLAQQHGERTGQPHLQLTPAQPLALQAHLGATRNMRQVAVSGQQTATCLLQPHLQLSITRHRHHLALPAG
jgi:hypothetical protein